MKFSKSVLTFIRREKVFCIAFLAAFCSAFAIPPDGRYLSYIDFRVLFILFSLMLVVQGLRSCGIFDLSAAFLCRHVKNLRSLATVLVFLPFAFSMFITNDVALLTFVPFAIMLLRQAGGSRYLIYVVVLQTVAANLGSMLMPFGNPQNIFLYSKMGLGIWGFIQIVLPFSLLSLLLLLAALLAVPKKNLSREDTKSVSSGIHLRGGFAPLLYIFLFMFSVLAVLKVLPAWLAALFSAVAVFFMQKSLLKKVDYVLLLTFAAFFVFTGNMERLESVKSFLEGAVSGHEFVAGIIASQVISNVPSALLLYPFSTNAKDLLLGVNAGGLGTLVASLASLISYKLYATRDLADGEQSGSGRYVAVFTGVNLLFLLLLVLLWLVKNA